MSTIQPYHNPNILTHAKVLRANVLTNLTSLTSLTSLTHLNQWVAWKWGPPRKDGKQPKIPIDPHTGEKASVTDSGTWADFEAASEHEGIGFVLTREDEFTAVDLDECVNAGEVAGWAMEIVRALDSYTELSPSGTGLHIWVRGMLPKNGFKRNGIEGYSARRFMTWTGERFYGAGIEERQDELTALYERLHPAPLESTPQELRTDSRSADGVLVDDSDLLDKARGADKLGWKFVALYDAGNISVSKNDASAADNDLMCQFAFLTGKDALRMERLFSSSALGQRDKWKNRADYRRRTIANAIARTSKVYDPKHKPRETTREGLERRMSYALFCHEWNTGRASAAATDYSCYRVMVEKAHKANTDTVDMSIRELCETAGIGSYETAVQALRRQEDTHRLLVKVANGKDGAATYRLKPVDSKVEHILIRNKLLSKGVTTTNTVSIRSMCTVLSQTLNLRNPAPDMPDFDRNGRKIPKGKPSPVDSLVKVCGWILDMVSASQNAVSLSFLSERCGVRPNNLKKRYIIPMTVAGLIRETEEGYMTTENVEQALKDELEISGCNERADLQRERHNREREAYHMRKNEKTDTAPSQEEMDTMREQRENIEDFPEPTKPLPSVLVVALRDYLDEHPDA